MLTIAEKLALGFTVKAREYWISQKQVKKQSRKQDIDAGGNTLFLLV
jgi:hypothetical protein